MKTSKKFLAFALVSVLMLSALTGCSNKNGGASGKFDTAREINVLTAAMEIRAVKKKSSFITFSLIFFIIILLIERGGGFLTAAP